MSDTFLEAVRITDAGLAAQMDADENPTIAVMAERLSADIGRS
jgi:hypothetical protein